jgi:predicted ferric reductase
MNDQDDRIDLEVYEPAMSLQGLLLLMAATVTGALLAIVVLPYWLPGLSASLQGNSPGDSPKVFWFLSRASAMVAFVLLWFSMVFGLLITNKLARLWPGGPHAFNLHQHFSLLGLAFGLFHGLILMGDQYLQFNLRQVLLPFASANYRPFWVGLGQLTFYLMCILVLSFYIRRRISPRLWRLIHFLSFVVYGMALVHGIYSGTDAGTVWVKDLYAGSAGLLLFLFNYRVLVALTKPRSKAVKQLA